MSSLLTVARRILSPLGAAALTPLRFSLGTGHLISSLSRRSVSWRGQPLPWYTYPCIDLLASRDWSDSRVVEFGGGASTLWWASRARSVITLEGDPKWAAALRRRLPSNADLRLVVADSPEQCVENATRELSSLESAEVVVVDGLFRRELLPLGTGLLSEGGALIVDNSEGYRVQEWFSGSDFQRVDFFGFCPGLFHPHCTSIFFRGSCRLFDSRHPIPKRHAG